MTGRAALRARGRQVAEERLLRARPLLEAVSPAERAAIEEAAYAVALQVADCVLEEAARSAPLAAALAADAPLAGPGRQLVNGTVVVATSRG